MLVAVTGATGLVGRYLTPHLLAGGHSVRAWYRPSSDRSGLPEGIDWRQGQLGDAGAAEALVRGADAVVHAAVDWSERHGSLTDFLEVNFMGSIRLMEAARAAGVRRFVFISSCAVHEVILPDRPLDEAHPLWPTGHYGAHKAALEAFVSSYGRGHGWPVCALRPTGIYGLDHPPEKSNWYDLVGKVLRGEPISSAHGGKEVHAADVARAVELLLTTGAEWVAGEVFNCYDRYVAEEEVARIAKEISGSPSRVEALNRGPKNQIRTDKLRALGMTFGGEELLRRTVAELVAAHRKGGEGRG
ncbi:MAG TPA: NAD(P)-dependent oxidoreductase [Gemmataceae bacterium]